MNAVEQDMCVTMVHEDLKSTPEYKLSPDYYIRWYKPGDEEIWTTIQRASDKYNTIDKNLFFREFPEDSYDLSHRQCYICDQSQNEVGTATAWENSQSPFIDYGLIHWMAVLPKFQNQGIGKTLMGTICLRLLSLGYKKAYLRTSTLRPNAIGLYKKFGFEVVSTEPWN